MEAKRIKNWAILLVSLLVLLWLAFYKENLLTILRTEFAIVWMFLLPGYCIFRKKEWAFLEKVVMGALLAGAIYGISSYYLGLLGLNVKWHIWLIPSLVMLASVLVHKKSQSQERKSDDGDGEPKGNQRAEPVDGNGHKDES